ncbi:MAG: leucyl aminopeptidase [Synergistaceae bacterium]|jgi:leucyl aminopeptidase|nr:leucyl aminopeptidase [Synergistaceae bacterium]
MIDVAVLGGSAEGAAEKWEGDALLVLMSEEDCKGEAGGRGADGKFAAPCGSCVGALVERGDFDGKKGTVTKVPLFEGKVKNLYLAGLGKSSGPKSSSGADGSAPLREVLTSALRRIGRERNESAFVSFGGHGEDGKSGERDVVLGEAAELCGYVFDKYKKKEDGDEGKFVLKTVFAPGADAEKVKQGQVFARAQILARDLANEPGNVVNPPALAEIAARFAEERGLACEVWDEKRLARENMGALLAVGQGSATPPRLIHLTCAPGKKGRSAGEKPLKKIVFVGKGITFDSGGLDLKSSEFMKTMKGDKSGACNVLGILDGAVKLGLEAEIHGIIAAAENMPGGRALRPDDIIRARNGKTIEIDNTDAEGRLVLADALAVACELKPDVVIDMATLTGACAVALGNWSAGLFTADDALSEALLASARRRGERLWRLPMDDEKIGESLKSKFADLVNSGSRYGGATFGAMFLAEFVEPGIAWAHMDIAGADFMKEEGGLYARGASAFGVRTCLDYAAGL